MLSQQLENESVATDLEGRARGLLLMSYTGIRLEGPRKTQKTSEQSVSGSRSENGTSLIRSTSVNHLSTTFGDYYYTI
jgi:hypothetical protein